MLNSIPLEKRLERFSVDIYPITIVKFLLNKKKILNYFDKAASEDFRIRGKKFTIDNSNCEFCRQKQEEGIANLCRQHTSIHRVLSADRVLLDEDTNAMFYKNEIFKQVGNRLVVIYCPHTKPISGKITDQAVRKITPLTIEDDNFKGLPNYETKLFLSSSWMDENLRCWFNNDFSIVTVPNDRNKSNFVLVCNE